MREISFGMIWAFISTSPVGIQLQASRPSQYLQPTRGAEVEDGLLDPFIGAADSLLRLTRSSSRRQRDFANSTFAPHKRCDLVHWREADSSTRHSQFRFQISTCLSALGQLPNLLTDSRSPSACSRWRANSTAVWQGQCCRAPRCNKRRISSSKNQQCARPVPRLFQRHADLLGVAASAPPRPRAVRPARTPRANSFCSVNATTASVAFNSAGTEKSEQLISERGAASLCIRLQRRWQAVPITMLASTGSTRTKPHLQPQRCSRHIAAQITPPFGGALLPSGFVPKTLDRPSPRVTCPARTKLPKPATQQAR